jgi:hypothetical protein
MRNLMQIITEVKTDRPLSFLARQRASDVSGGAIGRRATDTVADPDLPRRIRLLKRRLAERDATIAELKQQLASLQNGTR